MPVVADKGICVCDTAPMGHGGLEGYTEKMHYKYERMMEPGIPSQSWYRVYHDDEYFETCSTGIFKQHFKIVSSTSAGHQGH